MGSEALSQCPLIFNKCLMFLCTVNTIPKSSCANRAVKLPIVLASVHHFAVTLIHCNLSYVCLLKRTQSLFTLLFGSAQVLILSICWVWLQSLEHVCKNTSSLFISTTCYPWQNILYLGRLAFISNHTLISRIEQKTYSAIFWSSSSLA